MVWSYLPKRFKRLLLYPDVSNTPSVKKVTNLMLGFNEEEERKLWMGKHVAAFVDSTDSCLKELVSTEKGLRNKAHFAMGLSKKEVVKSREITRILNKNGVTSSNLGTALDELAKDKLIELSKPDKDSNENAERHCRMTDEGFEALREWIKGEGFFNDGEEGSEAEEGDSGE